MKRIKIWSMMMLVAMAIPLMTGCGGDDGDNGGSGNGSNSGWYIPDNFISTKIENLSNAANQWIEDGFTGYFDDRGQLQNGGYDAFRGEYTYDGKKIVIQEAGFEEDESVTWRLIAIHIINDNTLEAFFGAATYRLGASGAQGKQLLFTTNFGSIVGSTGYYAHSKRLYTYDYIDKNRFFFGKGSDGVYEEFNMLNGQLYQNGGSVWVKFDPTTVYQGKVTATGPKYQQ